MNNRYPFALAWIITLAIVSGFAFLIVWKGLPGQLNEIGDAIAGPAALLAFVWLIVTIRLQYIELVDQRQISEGVFKETEAQTSLLRDTTQAPLAKVHSQIQSLEIARRNFVRAEERARTDKISKEVGTLLRQVVYQLVPLLRQSSEIDADIKSNTLILNVPKPTWMAANTTPHISGDFQIAFEGVAKKYRDISERKRLARPVVA